MIDGNDFDYDLIDISEHDANHSMNSGHFIDSTERATFSLHKKFGVWHLIYIVIDNGSYEVSRTRQPKKCGSLHIDIVD
jgi:hypothetical protein